MALFIKAPVRTVLFFLFVLLISIRLYSQEQKINPIFYQDTVILHSPFFPIILDANHLNLSRPLMPECLLTKPLYPPLRISHHKLFSDVYNKNAINRQTYDYLMIHNLRQIKYTTDDFSGKVETLDEIPSNIFQFLFKIDTDDDAYSRSKPERFQPKRRYWTFNGDHKIQLSQNFISDNWYKGGVKNLNLLNTQTLNFNYEKNKFQTNHSFEWRLSIYTNPNDTVRAYRIGEDLVRTYSNFGIHAFKNWYYSSNIEIKTQLFNKFNQNSNDMLSAIFSPLYINIGFLGIRYQIEKLYPKVKGKKLNFSADISPLSIEYVTVLNMEIDPHRFGIEEGKRHLKNLGSKVNFKLNYSLNKNVKFNSRLDYFTNYEKVIAEFENKLDMPINRYFSTTLYLYVRYDDNPQVVKDKSLGYFQINELLTFGFSYKW